MTSSCLTISLVWTFTRPIQLQTILNPLLHKFRKCGEVVGSREAGILKTANWLDPADSIGGIVPSVDKFELAPLPPWSGYRFPPGNVHDTEQHRSRKFDHRRLVSECYTSNSPQSHENGSCAPTYLDQKSAKLMISVHKARHPPCHKSAKNWQIRQCPKSKISKGPSPAQAAP